MDKYTYTTNVECLNASEDLRDALRALGFKSGMPAIPRGSHCGSFWLFGEDAKKVKSMSDKKGMMCVESAKRKFFITSKPNDKAMFCEFSVRSK